MDNESTEAAVAVPQPPAFQPIDTRWSWSAFLMGPFFLIAVRKYSWLWFYLLCFIPLLGVLLMLGFMVVLGMKGRQLVAESPSFSNADERNGFLKASEHAAKVLTLVYLLMLALVAVVVVMMLSAAATGMQGVQERAREAAEMQNSQMEQMRAQREAGLDTRDIEQVSYPLNAVDGEEVTDYPGEVTYPGQTGEVPEADIPW